MMMMMTIDKDDGHDIDADDDTGDQLYEWLPQNMTH